MKNNLGKFLAIGSLVVGGVVTGAGSAGAVRLAPGEVQIDLDGAVFTWANYLDLTTTIFPSAPYTDTGAFDNSQLPVFVDPDSGIFGASLPDGRTFLGTSGEIVDLFTPKAFVPFDGPGGTQDFGNGQWYDVTADLGLPSPVEFLLFDTDGDGLVGSLSGLLPDSTAITNLDTNDFAYVYTAFKRTITGTEDTGFDVRLDLKGYFYDQSGTYEDTESVLSFFNGTISRDPFGLPFYEDSPASGFDALSSADGLITTVEVGVPESSPVSALIGFGLVGSAFALKRKVKVG
jgi:hypothetical protein